MRPARTVPRSLFRRDLRKRLQAGFLVLLGLAVAGGAQAEGGEVVRAFSSGLKTLEGRFEQTAFDADGRLRERSRGGVALAAPRQFRWDYEDPFPQTIVADGQRIWIYDPELEQVSVRPQAHEEASSPLAALIDPTELQRQFVVSELGERDGLAWLLLTPRQGEDAAFSEARIGFAGEQLRRMELVDALQQRSVIEFSDWKRNAGLDPGVFRFVPPPGVDVVGEVGDDAEVFAVPEGQ